MRTRIKFCGLVRPVDVDAAVAVGVDAIGLVFYPKSPRLLAVDDAAALRRRLPSFVLAVGLVVNATPEEVDALRSRVGLDVVQFHGDESPEQCARVAPTPWWRALRVGAQPFDFAAQARRFDGADCILVDADSPGYGGSGHVFDWDAIPHGHGTRLVASGGLHAGNVGEAMARLRPFAVDSSTGIQGAGPREKDPAKMEAFADAVRRADAAAAPSR